MPPPRRKAPGIPAPSELAPSERSGGDGARTAEAAKVKVGYYQSNGEIARARGAYRATLSVTAHRSFSDFIAVAVQRYVSELEARYNDGRAWTALEPGELPAGRPLGE